MRHNDCVAMILAGGQGSRLGALTNQLAKPAVPFGGKYRIIDFALSNCANSGISTVGVLTQYQPLELNTYIGTGQPWDLDRINGGVYVLPPYMTGKTGEWYKGTANAIYQNERFIEQFSPDNVLILSGDHIYKMDYRRMLSFHQKSGAALTIAVFSVPLSEASRYGILSADENGRIYDFTEKPKNPTSTLASMGVYIFDWKALHKYLNEDEANPSSSNDFGKDIIPAMLADGCPIYAYSFSGYWKDVGTISSLYEANMDLLGDNPVLNLDDDEWKIYCRHTKRPSQYIGSNAELKNCCVADGCVVDGTIEHSLLFSGAVVEEGAVVTDSILFPGAHVCKGAKIDHAMLAGGTVIGEGAVIGADKGVTAMLAESPLCDGGITLVAENVEVSAGTIIGRNVVVSASV
ncbi:MAG: glucose-1-phosphate adenylyltransferase [Ruminococcaceae bacterium]|nr:glucose-1-phosphate adenylyltransferase [Oscillospiraceae bacterium]